MLAFAFGRVAPAIAAAAAGVYWVIRSIKEAPLIVPADTVGTGGEAMAMKSAGSMFAYALLMFGSVLLNSETLSRGRVIGIVALIPAFLWIVPVPTAGLPHLARHVAPMVVATWIIFTGSFVACLHRSRQPTHP